GLGVDTRDGGEQLVDEEGGVTVNPRVETAEGGREGEPLVVRCQEVLTVEIGGDHRPYRQLEDPLDDAARRGLDDLGEHRGAVDVQPELLGGGRPAGVGDGDPRLQATGDGRHREV